MPKVPPSRSRRPAATTATLNIMRKHYQQISLDPAEIKIVHYLLFSKTPLRWTMYIGKNFANETALLVGLHPSTFKEKVDALIERGWLRKGINGDRQTYVELTTRFGEACLRAEGRWLVKFTLGAERWQKINGDDEMADLFAERARGLTGKEYKDCVRAAANEVANGDLASSVRSRQRRPLRSPTATSGVANGDLKLIKGGRKYGA